MASKSQRKIIAALSLCESCALSILNSNGRESDASILLLELVDELKVAAQEARRQWRAELTKNEADKITQCMKKADFSSPISYDNQEECTIYYASLALGLLDELFSHIQDSRKLKHLGRVERALRGLCNFFDRGLDCSSIYEQASRGVAVWLECLNE